MQNTDNSKNGTLQLPVQSLDLESLEKISSLRKMVLQFELDVPTAGGCSARLVAYPLYKDKKKKKFGKQLQIGLSKDPGTVFLPLPLTLGTLELSSADIKKIRKSGTRYLFFKPFLYDKNVHAAYELLDDSGQLLASINPIPPARPEEA